MIFATTLRPTGLALQSWGALGISRSAASLRVLPFRSGEWFSAAGRRRNEGSRRCCPGLLCGREIVFRPARSRFRQTRSGRKGCRSTRLRCRRHACGDAVRFAGPGDRRSVLRTGFCRGRLRIGLDADCMAALVARRLERSGSAIGKPFGARFSHRGTHDAMNWRDSRPICQRYSSLRAGDTLARRVACVDQRVLVFVFQ